jgi:hypothetical protein
MKKNQEIAKLESAIEAMIPLLQTASQASHKIKEVGKSWSGPLIVWLAIIAALWFGPAACSQQASETQAPDKFENAVLLKICSDGTHVLRLTDGTVWADDYRVEDWRVVC